MNTVLIDCEGITEPAWIPSLDAFVKDVLSALGRDGWEVSLLLCDDPTIARINGEFRSKDEATDVLSFPQVDSASDIPRHGDFVAGDIVVSLDSVRSNASSFNVSPDEEFKRLVIHGILHLSGLDHATNDASEPMLLLQEKLLSNYKGETVFTL